MANPQNATRIDPEKKRRVFVSHAADSRDLAKYVSQQLREIGIESFSDDTDMPIGADLRKWLKESIENTDAIIALVTPKSIDSGWMVYELGLAAGLDRLVIPVVVDVQADQLPPQIKKRRTLKLDELDQVKDLIARAVNTAED